MRREFGLVGAGLLASACLAGASAEAACNLELKASLPLTVENGRLFVPGKIGDHPVEFMVNLGSTTVLLEAAGRDFGITPDNFRSLSEKALLGDMEKQASLGPDANHDVAMSIAHLPIRLAGTRADFGSPQAVAVLGMDLLAQYDVEFDVAHQTLNLFHPTGCEDAKLAYWTKRYTVSDMVANITRPLNVGPYTVYNFPHINIRGSLNGQDLVASLNSGFKETSLSLTAAHSAGVDTDNATEVDSTPDILDGYSSRTWLGSFGKVSLAQESVAPVKLRIHSFTPPIGSRPPATGVALRPARNVGDDLVLGADFFITHRVLVAYSQNKVYYSYEGGGPFLGGTPELP